MKNIWKTHSMIFFLLLEGVFTSLALCILLPVNSYSENLKSSYRKMYSIHATYRTHLPSWNVCWKWRMAVQYCHCADVVIKITCTSNKTTIYLLNKISIIISSTLCSNKESFSLFPSLYLPLKTMFIVTNGTHINFWNVLKTIETFILMLNILFECTYVAVQVLFNCGIMHGRVMLLSTFSGLLHKTQKNMNYVNFSKITKVITKL